MQHQGGEQPAPEHGGLPGHRRELARQVHPAAAGDDAGDDLRFIGLISVAAVRHRVRDRGVHGHPAGGYDYLIGAAELADGLHHDQVGSFYLGRR